MREEVSGVAARSAAYTTKLAVLETRSRWK